MIAIVDYGAGNLMSVSNALGGLGVQSSITGDPDAIFSARGIILPGVGDFGAAMANMRKAGLDEPLMECIARGTPFLGICLGMQLLFEKSEESPGCSGLGIFKGGVTRLKPGAKVKVPHIGYNSVALSEPSRLFKNLPQEPHFYFVHSYCCHAENGISTGETFYGENFHSYAERENLFACQFHPEKSGALGMRLLQNFIEVIG